MARQPTRKRSEGTFLSNVRFALQRMRRSSSPPCEHVDQVRAVERRTQGCAECEEQSGRWVHLRMCLTCGHLGCGDSSRGKHATRHFRESSHAIMRSIEAGESWTWCYLDKRIMASL